MPRYKLTLEYHGGPFVGWQRQADGVSVQGVLEQALSGLVSHDVLVQGAGRTDAGVHATGQVAHCDLSDAWDPFRLAEALNYHLRPHPVAVMSAETISDEFHARFDATARHYLYRVVCRRATLTIDKGLAWRVPNLLDIAAMRQASAYLVGHHDFTTFRSAQCQAASPVKTLDRIEITRTHNEIRFEFSARSFLHNQVRSLVGTLSRVGTGKWAPTRVRDALHAKDRSTCGPVAPPDGLYLTAVDYAPPEIEGNVRDADTPLDPAKTSD